MAKKNDDLFLVGVEFAGNQTFKLVKFGSKHTGKALISIIKATITEIKQIKHILNNKVSRYMFAACTATFLLILAYLNYKISFLGLFSYFVISGTIKSAKEYLHNKKIALKISKNNKKYKRLVGLFNNKIDVVNVKEDRVTIFSNEITKNELEKFIPKFELFFNRKIAYVISRKGNFKYNDIFFFVETKFKKFYKFEEYINFVDIKKVNKMELPMVLGIDQDNKFLLADLVSIKYLFVAGEAGGGKSVLLNAIIQSLMLFTNNVLYILVDLKEGVEMSDYDKFPNCLVCATKEEFNQVIKVVNQIMIKRLKLIRETDSCKNIQAYNAKKDTENMNYIVMIIDEIAEVKLNSDKSTGRSEEETILLQILQKGRAGGVHIIGATQRPGVDQIDGSVRAGFQKSISFCVSTPETQRMTKIQGTETLKEGEFKTNILGNTNKIYKGFLILEEAIKNKGLPKCNGVFEDLKHVLVDNKFFIEIKEKEVKKDKLLLQKLLVKVNKSYPEELPPVVSYPKYIKSVSNAVISDITSIKKLSGVGKISIGNEDIIHGGNYEKILQYIFVNFNETNGLVPGEKQTNEDIGIDRKEREKLLARALKEGFIEKANKTRYKVNIKFPGWDIFKKNMEV